ncbi:hypothetical protein D3C87_1257890 [compost metagenome]
MGPTVVQQLVAADPLVQHHEPTRAGRLETARQDAGPVALGPQGRGRALGDGIAEGRHHRRRRLAFAIDGGDHVLAVIEVDLVAGRVRSLPHPDHRAAHGGAGRIGEAQADRDLGEGRGRQGDRIADQDGADRDHHLAASVKENRRGPRLALQAQLHVGHAQRRIAQFVADPQPQRARRGAQTHVLADGLSRELHRRLGRPVLAVRRGRGGPDGAPDLSRGRPRRPPGGAGEHESQDGRAAASSAAPGGGLNRRRNGHVRASKKNRCWERRRRRRSPRPSGGGLRRWGGSRLHDARPPGCGRAGPDRRAPPRNR